MSLPLPSEYPVYVGFPPVDAEYPCITYTQDASDNKFIGLLRGTQVYALTAWASTRSELHTIMVQISDLFGYQDENIADVFLENSQSGFQDGLYYKTVYIRVVLNGTYRR